MPENADHCAMGLRFAAEDGLIWLGRHRMHCCCVSAMARGAQGGCDRIGRPQSRRAAFSPAWSFASGMRDAERQRARRRDGSDLADAFVMGP